MIITTLLGDICASLGVPPTILAGGAYATNGCGYMRQFEDDIRTMCEKMTEQIVAPAVERCFPEMYWETAFIMSPRGRAMRRREKPVQIVWG